MAAPLRGFFKALEFGFDLEGLDCIRKGTRLIMVIRIKRSDFSKYIMVHYEYLYILIMNFLCQAKFYSSTLKIVKFSLNQFENYQNNIDRLSQLRYGHLLVGVVGVAQVYGC